MDHAGQRSLRVLVVDDNPDHSRLAADFLAMAGPFEVIAAGDLAQLWELLASDVFDIILLDYNLPDGNGLDALEAVPARGYQLPIVMVTGRGDERVAAQAIQRGAIDYLVKTGDYLRILPAMIEKAVRTQALLLSNQLSLEKVRYQALLLDNIDDAVVVWDMHDQITFWNQAAEKLLGWSAPERLGQSAVHTYFSVFTPPIEAAAPLAGGASVERHGRRRSGEDLWVSSHVSELLDSAGRLIGYLDVSRDITSRKQLEAHMIATQAQLTQATRLAAVGALATSVAHEMSNPLTTVIAEAQLLRRELNDADALESAQAIETAGLRAQAAVQRLLEHAQVAQDELRPVCLNETIERALTTVRAYVESASVRVALQLDPDLPPVWGQPQQLEDLWTNLLLLARAAADDSRPHRITITSGRDSRDGVQVTVHDDGRHIPAEQLPLIFEPALTPAGPGRGMSLELSLCHEIVQRHGGEILADSNPATGTTMTVRLLTHD